MVKQIYIIIILCFCVSTLFAQNDSIVYIGINNADEMPVFGGEIADFVQDNVKYPESAISDFTQGSVYITFYVETTGVTTNHVVLKGIREDLDNEALRVAKLLVFDKPAMQRGRPVKILHNVIINFNLNGSNKNSQELFTKELVWVLQDSIETLIFQDKNQIYEWGKTQLPFSIVSSKDFSSKGMNINVVLVSGCSGIHCWNIYVFTEDKGAWHLVAKTNARLKDQLLLDVDSTHEKIIFKTNSSQIGELPYEALSLKHDKIE